MSSEIFVMALNTVNKVINPFVAFQKAISSLAHTQHCSRVSSKPLAGTVSMQLSFQRSCFGEVMASASDTGIAATNRRTKKSVPSSFSSERCHRISSCKRSSTLKGAW